MIVRNGDDYMTPCIEAVAPHVKKIKICMDSRSNDDTYLQITRLVQRFPNVEGDIFKVLEPNKDLVAMRNTLLSFDESWGLIMDSDEYHYDIQNLQLGDKEAYLLQCFAVWDEKQIHKSSSKAKIGRLFKNQPHLQWKGGFGREKLYVGDKPIFDDAPMLDYRYIHFTHIKKDTWRSEMRQKRIADGKNLSKTPQHIINITNSVHERMSSLPKYR